MAQAVNSFKTDLRELRFLLFEQFNLHELLGKAPFAEWNRDDVEMILDEARKWTYEVLGPTNSLGDVGCKLVDGKVTVPPEFKKVWQSLYQAGWRSVSTSLQHGGQGGPWTLHALIDEMGSGANVAFNMYPGLTDGVAEVIEAFATDEQIKTYFAKLKDGTWSGTMCLTEPHAGSDVGAATTKAVAIDGNDGKYRIEGTKIFISCADHDLTENIIHLVLARTAGGPAGTKGLSLFMVPRDRFDGSGNNDVKVGSLEKKMGINGSSTCVLNFGEDGECIGELVGTQERQGMRQMFRMMNFARIAVGMQGLGVASVAYLNALQYAKERKQGPNVKNWKDAAAPRVPIIQHPDVRRMLLDMKSRVEGIRALAVKLAMHTDHVTACQGNDDESAAYHQGQVDLLVPLVKAYATDQAFNICATAIQVLGGAGYLKDHPMEQACRDAKIFSIYEGTNHIQALDLCARKLNQRGGANFQAFIKDVSAFIQTHKEHPALGPAVAKLAAATESLTGTAMRFLAWFQGGEVEMVPLVANRFLEMMAETVVGWLLLEGAVIAEAKLSELADGHADRNFYLGKKLAAVYFGLNVLPGVVEKAGVIGTADRSILEIPEEAFATV